MSRDDLHFRLRIPEALKQQIEDAAEANHRSMTAEIISRLEGSFRSPFDELKDPNTAKQTEGFLKLVLEAVKLSEGSDKVFYIGSRNIGDDPEEDSLLGISEAHDGQDRDAAPDE